jgi:hypothetical protein
VISRVESYEGNAQAATQAIIAKSEEQQAIVNENVAVEENAQLSLQPQGEQPQSGGEEEMNELATDDEILRAEKELGFDLAETEHIPSSMEPLEDIAEASSDASQTTMEESDDKKDFEI